jgi:hypothetical protein
MRLRFLAGLAVAGMASMAVTACNKGFVDPASNTTSTFTGTLQPGDAAVHTFTVSRNGEMTVTFESLTPPLPLSTIPTEIRVTETVGGNCVFGAQIVADNPFSTPNPARAVISGGAIFPGQYCLWISDEGFYKEPETYVVTVSHP